MTVDVKIASYSRIFGLTRFIRAHVATWGAVSSVQRKIIDTAAAAVIADVDPISRLAGQVVTLNVSKIKKTLALLARLGAVVHSARNVMASDMRRVLGLIKTSREELTPYVQLDLFDDET